MLISVRLWLPRYATQRVTVRVRGDNVASLQMAAKMQPKSPALGVVARELALDLSMASYSIDLVEHIAGITNGVADALSRKRQDGKKFILPSLLRNAREVSAPVRNKRWWLTRSQSND